MLLKTYLNLEMMFIFKTKLKSTSITGAIGSINNDFDSIFKYFFDQDLSHILFITYSWVVHSRTWVDFKKPRFHSFINHEIISKDLETVASSQISNIDQRLFNNLLNHRVDRKAPSIVSSFSNKKLLKLLQAPHAAFKASWVKFIRFFWWFVQL